MKKEKENIFLHIINDNYKTSKKKQSEHGDVTGKAILSTELQQKNASVLEKLRRMHEDFPTQSMDALDVSELYASYQKLVIKEQQLMDRKEDLLSKEQDLRKRLLREIDNKNKEINALQIEISVLQNKCEEISRELEYPNETTISKLVGNREI
jgi:hypothetical protein